MKKIILLLCAFVLVLSACAHGEKSPAVNTDISFDAVYTVGDFSFNCNIKWQGGTSYVTVTSTNAAGMTVSCNGRSVTFSRGAMLKTEDFDNIDASNPARLLYEIFTALENGGDKCSLGTFEVTYSDDEIESISVSDITVKRAR